MRLTGISLLLSAIIATYAPIYAATDDLPTVYTEKQITVSIGLLEKDLAAVRNISEQEIVRDEIAAIEKGIQEVKNFLADKKLEEAYYQVEITKSYFSKIEAKIELFYSRQVFDQTAKNLGK